MVFNIGALLVFTSIIFGFMLEGGNIAVLYQPFAAMIIIGSALGIFIISNPRPVLRSIWSDITKIKAGYPYKQKDYIELLVFMFDFFRFARSKSKIELEQHIENPYQSSIFKQYPHILENRDATIFLCDHMRLIVLGYDNVYELENIIEEQIAVRKDHTIEVSSAFFKLGDTLPALGIVAAVLGVVNAMGSLHMEPEILGHKIASALIGTFFGVAFSYCVAIPLGTFLEKYGFAETKYFECIKAGFIAHARGNPPSISIEFARQAIPINLKPSFQLVEKSIEEHKKQARAKK